ncbi:hypothetical protein WDU94_011423, partial [Cyamophila willieti]
KKLAAELGIADDDVRAIGQEYVDNPRQQALVMLKLWMKTQGPNATGNNLEKGLRSIQRDDIVNQCIYNLEIVTDDMERAVAKTRLDQSGFDTLQDELGRSRDSTLNRSPSSRKGSHFHDDHSDIENEKFLDETSPSPLPDVDTNHSNHVEVEESNHIVIESNHHEELEPKHDEVKPNHHEEISIHYEETPNSPQEKEIVHHETIHHSTPNKETITTTTTTTVKQHSNDSNPNHSAIETSTTTTTTTNSPSKKSKKKNKKKVEPKALVSDFLSQEITTSSHQLVETPSPPSEQYPEDGTGWEKYHKTEGNGNVAWEFEAGEQEGGENGGGNSGKQELWRSPSLEAEMIINEDITHETRWSKTRTDGDSGSESEKEMKRSNSGNNNSNGNVTRSKIPIPVSSSGSDVAVREGGTDSEEETTNNGADLTHENSAQNIQELVSNNKS